MSVRRDSWKGKDGTARRTSKFYVFLPDHRQIDRKYPGFTDKRLTQALERQIKRLTSCRMAGELPDQQLMRWLESVPPRLRERFVKVGLIDSSWAGAGKPLLGHIADFKQSLLDKGNTRKQVQMTVSRVRRIAEGCKFIMWTDIAASKVQRYIARMQEDGLSKKTANYYLKAFQHFARWVVEDRRASTSPVAHLRTVEIQKQDIRRQRRPLEASEVMRLLKATQAASPRFGLSGRERAMIYRLACESGLRANELRLLTVGSFNFDNCTVAVRDHTAKNRKEKILPLKARTAAEIKELLASKLPAARAFKVPGKPVDMLRPDLEAAGIDYVDDAGRFCDFHSLRHTTGSLLAASGVHPKVAQEIMRHGDINLTMNLYTHTLRGQEADAVNRLPDFSEPSRENQKKTGTDNVDVTGNDSAVNSAVLCTKQCNLLQCPAKTNPTHGVTSGIFDRARQDSNLQPSDSK
ncbi:MAG: tyrosine-type recombinase/integrase, partial [Planctomycetota bacterium]